MLAGTPQNSSVVLVCHRPKSTGGAAAETKQPQKVLKTSLAEAGPDTGMYFLLLKALCALLGATQLPAMGGPSPRACAPPQRALHSSRAAYISPFLAPSTQRKQKNH